MVKVFIEKKKSKRNEGLDLSVLEEMVGGDKQVMYSLLVEYRDEFIEQTSELKLMIQQNHYEELPIVIHKIKPAVSYLGLKELSDLLDKRESKTRSISERSFFVEEIVSQLEWALKEIDKNI